MPGGCYTDTACLSREPSSPVVAVSKYRIAGRRTKERGPIVRNRSSAEHDLGDFRPKFAITETHSERDVGGPSPEVARLPITDRFTDPLVVANWGSCVRNAYAPSRKQYKPSVLASGAAMFQRNGDSPCLIIGGSSKEEALMVARTLNPFGRLLARSLTPVEKSCVLYNCQNPCLAKRVGARSSITWGH